MIHVYDRRNLVHWGCLNLPTARKAYWCREEPQCPLTYIECNPSTGDGAYESITAIPPFTPTRARSTGPDFCHWQAKPFSLGLLLALGS